tara:strand:- start:115 stop:924 length:810 start_codon:yes stop_codon:yes gene_type:complete
MSKKTNKVEPLWQWPGTKKSLELEEWWFEDCPDDELRQCWAYEIARHVHKMVWDYQEDKKNKFKYGGRDIRENGVWMNTIDLYDGGEEPVDQIGVLAPSGFPNKPYLKTNRSKIDKDKFPLDKPVYINPVNAESRIKHNFSVRFNWKYSNKRILAEMKNWLEQLDRPKPTKVQGQSPARSTRSRLNKLGAYRLLHFYGSVKKAQEFLDRIKKPYPFRYENKWSEAKKEITLYLKDINHQSGFWHPDLKLLPKKHFRTTPYWEAYSRAIK